MKAPFSQDLIWKPIRCIDWESPMEWKIVAVDIHWRIIHEYQDLPNEVFADEELKEWQLTLIDPEEVEIDIITLNWVRYKKID